MATIVSYHNEHGAEIHINKCNFLNNLVEQAYPGIKRIARPVMGFKSFEAAQATLTDIELMRMLRKEQIEGEEMTDLTVAEQFYELAA